MWRRPLNSATLAIAAHKELKEVCLSKKKNIRLAREMVGVGTMVQSNRLGLGPVRGHQPIRGVNVA